MPVRLPGRRAARPKGPKEFKRRSPPTPQATRLIKVSIGACLLFLAVLAAVFVPKALHYDQPPNPVAVLALRSSGPFVVEVVQINVVRPLDEFRGELNMTGAGQPATEVNMQPFSLGVWQNITFDDVDRDGGLSAGDTFTILPQSGFSLYRLLLYHVSTDVGPPPCPCAIARIVFP